MMIISNAVDRLRIFVAFIDIKNLIVPKCLKRTNVNSLPVKRGQVICE